MPSDVRAIALCLQLGSHADNPQSCMLARGRTRRLGYPKHLQAVVSTLCRHPRKQRDSVQHELRCPALQILT